MKVVIFGMGYVGITAGCCIASDGHRIVGIDISQKKVNAINAGKAPIVEPQVPEMLASVVTKGLLSADSVIGDHLEGADMAIVCVGTPSAADGAHNMGYVADVSHQIAAAVREVKAGKLNIVYRSTIRPGTIEELIVPIFGAALAGDMGDRIEMLYNPEFIREGTAVKDYLEPPKIVIGTADGKPNAAMEELNQNISAPTFYVSYREAEVTKLVDNTWHALKVAFANEIGRICLKTGISAKQVHEIFVSDTKLNISPYYMRPGGAFGGSCLPKDVRALQYLGSDNGANLHLVDSLIRSNEAHKHALFEYASEGLKPGAKILMAGLAFKAGTDDLRESPNVDLARKLLSVGFELDIYDPSIRADMLIGANLGYAYSQLPTLERILISKTNAEANTYDLVIGTNATIKDLKLTDAKSIRDLDTLP